MMWGVIDMEWMVPVRRLDEAQQDILRKCADVPGQTKWIEGFAGSGKTVLLIHAIQNYVNKNPDHKVCVVVFTHALIDLIKTGIAEEFKSKIPVMTYLNFVNNDKNIYNLVVIDEVQDVPASILKAISRKTEKLLIGGDDAQSIYDTGSRAEQIEQILQPERFKLPKVYRLTRKIINIVKGILPNNNIAAVTSGRMEEAQVTLAHANSKADELSWVWRQAKRHTETGHPSVIILAGHTDVLEFINFVATEERVTDLSFPPNRWGKTDYSEPNKKLEASSSGVCLQYLGSEYGSLELSDSRPVVFLMTYHSVKGLDFRTVFLPLLTSDVEFWSDQDIARRLFFVGATRSRRDLFMSYHGSVPHVFVQGIPQDELHKIEIESEQNVASGNDFVF